MAWLKELKTAQPTPMESKGATWTGSGIVRQPYVNYKQEWTIDRAVKEALTRVTWVYRSVQAIASNAARIPIIVRESNPYDGILLDNHPLYYPLNSKSNPGESSYVFRYRLSAQILLSSKGAFIEVVKTRGGKVSRLDLIPPQLVKPIPDPDNFVKYYEVSQSTTVYQSPKPPKRLKPEDVIWIRNPHPFDAYGSLTPLEALGLAIETDWYAKMYNRNFLLNDGRPGGLVVIKGEATQEDREELNARFRGNVMMAGRISVITSDQGADFVDTAVNPRDAQYTDTRKLTKEEILLGFGVPESVLSNASGRTFDNADVERVIFWQETIIPHLELITRELDVLDPDDNHYVGVDLDRVDVLQRMDMKRKEYAMREHDAGLIDADEYREETGRKATGTPQGKVLFRANTQIPFTTTVGEDLPDDTHGLVNAPMDTPEEAAQRQQDLAEEQSRQAQAQAEAAARISAGGQDGPGKPQDQTVKPDQSGTPANPSKPKPARNDPRPKPLANAPKKEITQDVIDSAVNDFERWSMTAEGAIKRMLDRQHRVLSEKVNSQKTRKMLQRRSKMIESGHGSELSVKTAVDSVFDKSTWDQQLQEDLDPVLRGVYREFSKARAEAIEETSAVAETVIAHELGSLCDVNKIIEDAIQEGFAAYVIASQDSADPAEKVLAFFDSELEEKINKIVKRAVVAVANGAIWDSTMESGGERKTWVCLNGSSGPSQATVAINQSFQLKGSKARYPGDPEDPNRKSHGLAILVIE